MGNRDDCRTGFGNHRDRAVLVTHPESGLASGIAHRRSSWNLRRCGGTISALLPRNEETSRWTLFTVVSVTALSTMIVYPIIATILGLGPQDTGLFLGTTIHDVAQVMGAGYAVSDETGDTAALVKMMRVSMLVPIVLACALFISQLSNNSARLRNPSPWFVALCDFIAINSMGFVPPFMSEGLSTFSLWCLIVGIAAMGMRTSFKDVLSIGSVL